MKEKCGCVLLVQRSFLDLWISARFSDAGRPGAIIPSRQVVEGDGKG